MVKKNAIKQLSYFNEFPILKKKNAIESSERNIEVANFKLC